MAEEKKTKSRIGKTALITLASIGGIIAIVTLISVVWIVVQLIRIFLSFYYGTQPEEDD